jgi:hypothetical protein
MDRDQQFNCASGRDTTQESFGRLFKGRPLVEGFLLCSVVILVGYPCVIAIANVLQWSWLQTWLDVCSHIVGFLRRLLPVFNNFERELTSHGFGHRVPVVQHLLAFGWIAFLPIFAVISAAIWTSSRNNWTALLIQFERHVLFLGLIAAIPLFLWSAYFGIFGLRFVSSDPFMDWSRSDFPLISIGIIFSSMILFGAGIQMFLGALIVARRIDEGA